jgi:isopentenyldiphosphate isomerase
VEERFDIYDESGRFLGYSRPRSRVHYEGDWHRSIALWIVHTDGALVLQRRSMLKDTHPGLLTASVSGHYSSGEKLAEVLREAREELGVEVAEPDIVPIGLWHLEDYSTPTVIDRELQDVFLWPTDRPLTAFMPNSSEVMGLVELQANDFLALLNGFVAMIDARWLETGGSTPTSVQLGPSDFVPMHAYHLHVVRAAQAYLEAHFRPLF